MSFVVGRVIKTRSSKVLARLGLLVIVVKKLRDVGGGKSVREIKLEDE